VKIIKQLLASFMLLTYGSGVALADYKLNLSRGVTKVSNDIYDLHMLILWICVFIGIGVFGTMFYSIYHHRKSRGHKAEQFHENTTVEIIWTIIPTLILVSMAIPATKTMLELGNIENADMTVKVTGKQWYWEYDYLDNGIHIVSRLDEASNKARQLNSKIDPRSIPNYLLEVDHPLVIPTNKKIRFVLTSADVIHSWWVPAFGWKKDANPGFINEAWTTASKPGTYRGQCTELCGKDHGFMPIVVVAMNQPDYDAWVKKAHDEANKGPDLSDLTRDDLVAKGATIYEKNCSTCHMPTGEGVPGAFPALKGSKIVNGDIKAQLNLVLNGKNAMPAFGKVLKADELAEVITYTRNALGNSVGDALQPKEVASVISGAPLEPMNATKPAPEVKAEKPKTVVTERLTQEQLIAKGKEVYEANCVSCHQADGKGMPPTFPALTGSAIVNGDIQAQVKFVAAGKGMMPAFGGILDDIELASVVTYTRNALGNSLNDGIQPEDVKALK
jgi:cytochrome c oxidase subunit 2